MKSKQQKSCEKKTTYGTKGEAKKNWRKLKDGTVIERPYKCNFCHQYHLTTMYGIINRRRKE